MIPTRYSAVTFIYSKTDDISRTEATDSLQLGKELEALEDKRTRLAKSRRGLREQVKDVKATKADIRAALEDIENQLDDWKELWSRADDGEAVYAPLVAGSKKRQRCDSARHSRKLKRAKRQDDSDFTDYTDSSSDHDISDTEVDQARRGNPLTLEQIDSKLAELKDLEKAARRKSRDVRKTTDDLDHKLSEIEDQESRLVARQDQLCIAGRNAYSRDAIRQDFAAGIEELDQENALEEDDEAFNPDEDLRDYEEVARSLPVFCVSSRAYQKLSGRSPKTVMFRAS